MGVSWPAKQFINRYAVPCCCMVGTSYGESSKVTKRPNPVLGARCSVQGLGNGT